MSAEADFNAQLVDNLRWMIQNPEFEERPPSIADFLGPDYLDIRSSIRDRIFAELVNIFGDEFVPGRIAKYQEALITGGIGIGKTTIASIVLSYMLCCTLCLKDPQGYYDLIRGSKIAFMMMSSKRAVALEVIFQDCKARIDNSPWFKSRYPRDDTYKNRLVFPKNLEVIPGDSLETTFEGYNILGGIIDEIDSHKVTLAKDYVESGYSTISARISSRFGKRGFLVLIGQTKTEGGFAMRRMEDFLARPHDRYAVKMAIWESLNKNRFSGKVFYYDTIRSRIIHPDEFVRDQLDVSPTLITIPFEYFDDFDKDPDKALRDLAGIPRAVEDPFIRNTDKIFSAIERFELNHPVLKQPWKQGRIDRSLACHETLNRLGHIDLAYSANTGDAAALAIGHISGYVDTDEGPKPYIVIDIACRLKPSPGRQLELSEVRALVYELQGRGFKIKKVTLDGFQSTDTMQMLKKHRIFSELLSVDKLTLPYEDLRDAIYDERIEFPRVIDFHKRSDPKEQDVLAKELSELGYATNGKIDHPNGGTKDVADALAGVVHGLMLRARKGGATMGGPEVSGMRSMDQALAAGTGIPSSSYQGLSPLGMSDAMAKFAPSSRGLL